MVQHWSIASSQTQIANNMTSIILIPLGSQFVYGMFTLNAIRYLQQVYWVHPFANNMSTIWLRDRLLVVLQQC